MISSENCPALFFDGLDGLWELYHELDAHMEVFKAQIGLECLRYCKTCCRTAEEQVEITLLEALPLGIHLWQTGQAELWLEKLSRLEPEEPCLFFRREDSTSAWGCSCYELRPLVCRLFGFAAVLDKKGQPVFKT